jgi:hypothetical protein
MNQDTFLHPFVTGLCQLTILDLIVVALIVLGLNYVFGKFRR